MRVLTIDIGGTNVKVLSTGQTIPRKAPSGPTMTPKEMVLAPRLEVRPGSEAASAT